MRIPEKFEVARLPQSIRELLNERLRDGERGRTLVQRLNGLPRVEEEQMKAGIKAAEDRIDVYGQILREEYENKKKQGVLSSDEEARFQMAFAKLEEWHKRPRKRFRGGGFEIEPDQTQSNQIKPEISRNRLAMGPIRLNPSESDPRNRRTISALEA